MSVKQKNGNTQKQAGISLLKGIPTMNFEVTREVELSSGKVKRTAKVIVPQVGSFDEKGELVSGSVTLDALTSVFGSLDNVAEAANKFLSSRARQLAYADLGSADETTKQINKAIAALKALPNMKDLQEEMLRAIIATMPGMKEAIESSQNVPTSYDFPVTVERAMRDDRGRPAAESKDDSKDEKDEKDESKDAGA
jgi:hypothetical protein